MGSSSSIKPKSQTEPKSQFQHHGFFYVGFNDGFAHIIPDMRCNAIDSYNCGYLNGQLAGQFEPMTREKYKQVANK